MELEVVCDIDSYSLDESTIEVATDEMIAMKLNDQSDLTFKIKGLVNNVTGCLINDAQLYDNNNDSAKLIEDIESLGQGPPGVFKFKFLKPHIS